MRTWDVSSVFGQLIKRVTAVEEKLRSEDEEKDREKNEERTLKSQVISHCISHYNAITIQITSFVIFAD